MSPPLRVLYVFTARKQGLLDRAARGEEPDTLLFGFNHLASHGVQADLYEPQYGPVGRVTAGQLGRLGPDFLQLRTLPRFLRYDVVFLTGGWPLLLAALAIPDVRRPKIVWLNMTLTNLLRQRRPISRLLGLGIKQADHVVCVAHYQQAFLAAHLRLPPHRMSIALSGSDVAFYDASKASSSRTTAGPYVLAAGRDLGRDYATFIEATRGLPSKTHLVCSPANLRGLSIDPSVGVRYDIAPTSLRGEYAGAAVVAVPTSGDECTAGSDCSGTLVLLDALAMRRPAVITERASVHDYVSCNRHARCVPPADPAALREAIAGLLFDPLAAAQMASAGHEAVRQRYTTSHFAARLAEIFHTVAK